MGRITEILYKDFRELSNKEASAVVILSATVGGIIGYILSIII